MESENNIDISVLVTIASVGVIVLIVFIILFMLRHQRKMIAHSALINEKENNHQKVLLNASIEIAEQERANIAANIHDDIGMMLHVIKMDVNKANRNLDDKKLVNELLENTSKTIESTIDSIRIISSDLMPPALINIGFIEGMIELCNHINTIGIISIDLKTDLEHISIEEKTSMQLYRLLKEVLNNIIKHTKASKVEIIISYDTKILNIIISHNGKGISNEAIKRLAESSKGIGLRSIMARTQLINATVQYVIVDTDKSKIIIEMPIVWNG